MELKWTLIKSILIFSIILVPINAFFLKTPYKNGSNNDKEISLNLNTKNEPNINDNDITTTSFETTESAQYVNSDNRNTKVLATTSSEIIDAVHDILNNIQNNSLSSSKTIPDFNSTIVENDDLTTLLTEPSASNLETITENFGHHAEPLVSEASNLVRNLDETLHKIEDISSNIEIHELGTGSDSLEENIRNSVKDEISFDTADALDALEDIPDPEVRKAFVEDVLDGLNQKNILNGERIEENINMAKNIYVDDTIEITPPITSTIRGTTESLENLNSVKSLETNDNNSMKNVEQLTVTNSQNMLDNKNDEVELIQNLRISTENEDFTTSHLNLNISVELTTNIPENLEITTNSIENDSDFRQSRGLQNMYVGNSSPENSNDIRRLKNPLNTDGLSTQAQKILNTEKNRSGRTLIKEEFLTNDENIIKTDENIENNGEPNINIDAINIKIEKNNNLDEIIDTTTRIYVDNYETNMDINTENIKSNDENRNIDDKNLEENSVIHSEKLLNSENNLSEITARKIEENISIEENITENQTTVENLTENIVTVEPILIQDQLKNNIELEDATGKNIEENVEDNKKNVSIENPSTESSNFADEIVEEESKIQIENISSDVQTQTNDEENNNNKKILEENSADKISIENSSSQSNTSETAENKNDDIPNWDNKLKIPSTSVLEQNSNSIETEIEDTHSNEEIIQGKLFVESSTAQIGDHWSEVNGNHISSNEIINHLEDSFIEVKKSSIIEQNINPVQINEGKDTDSKMIEENPVVANVELENIEENLKYQPETDSYSPAGPEININEDDETTTNIPISLETTTTQNFKSVQEITKRLNEEILEIENTAIENIELSSTTEKFQSNNSNSSESSQSSESILQITSSTDPSSSSETTESSSTIENNLATTTIQDITSNQISKTDETTESSSSSSSEESSEERDKKNTDVKKPKITLYDILSGNYKKKQITDNVKINNSDNNNLSDDLLENTPVQEHSIDVQELKDETLNIATNVYPNFLPRQVLDKKFLTENQDNKDGLKIFIQSDETEKIPSLVFETTTILPLKILNTTTTQLKLLEEKRTFQSDEILKELENDTAALTETLIEAAELTTELSRHITSFRSIMETDIEIPHETHETIPFSSSNTMASANIGKALPNLSLKSEIIENNASIVILISTLTIIMIIGLLAVTFYRYRGKHGTLDIQLEEQRHGKDGNDDDDDSDTMSSLNDNASSSATQSLKSNKKDNTIIQTNELSLLSKSHDESD